MAIPYYTTRPFLVEKRMAFVCVCAATTIPFFSPPVFVFCVEGRVQFPRITDAND